MIWKSIIRAFGVFGFLSLVFLTAGLIAVGYFDYLHLESAVSSTSANFHDSLSHAQSTAEPVVHAMESGLSTNKTVTSAVLSVVKLLAVISLVSLIGYAVLLGYVLSRPATSKAPKNGSPERSR
jgi:hypothetical protein